MASNRILMTEGQFCSRISLFYLLHLMMKNRRSQRHLALTWGFKIGAQIFPYFQFLVYGIFFREIRIYHRKVQAGGFLGFFAFFSWRQSLSSLLLLFLRENSGESVRMQNKPATFLIIPVLTNCWHTWFLQVLYFIPAVVKFLAMLSFREINYKSG